MPRSLEETRKDNLDKFYTIPAVSLSCLDVVAEHYDWSSWDMVVEPSAGNGSFYTQIPTSNKIGIDISPEHESVVQHDFLTYQPPTPPSAKILVVGNPPFGKVSSLAIKFFNHAAEWAHTIAFIIPKTFRRVSVQNKLNLSFHLVRDEDIQARPCAFEPPMSVKCCFQIWTRHDTPRAIVTLPTTHSDWTFMKFGPKDDRNQPTPPTGADFAIRAYGGRCGDIVVDGLDTLRPKSWHWVKSNIDKEMLIQRFNTLDYSISKDTARQNSLGRAELVRLYQSSYSSTR